MSKMFILKFKRSRPLRAENRQQGEGQFPDLSLLTFLQMQIDLVRGMVKPPSQGQLVHRCKLGSSLGPQPKIGTKSCARWW